MWANIGKINIHHEQIRNMTNDVIFYRFEDCMYILVCNYYNAILDSNEISSNIESKCCVFC